MRIKQYEEEFGGNFRHYSMLQNVFYCIGNAAHCCFPLLIWCMIAVFINVAIPVLSTWLPNVVIETITAGYSLRELVVVILGFMGGLALLSGANQFFTKFIYFQKYRMNTFYVKQVTLKGLTTDYCNQENGSFRKFQTESVACCSGNYSPLSNVYEVLIRLLTGVVGMTIFGVILIRLDGRILLLLITTALISYFLNQKNLKWMEENNSEKIGYQQRLNYISRTAGDIRPAKDIRLYGMKEWFSKVYQSNMNGLDGWYRRLTVRLFGTALYDGGLALLRESMIYLYLLFLVFQNRITVADFVLYFGIVTGFSTWLDSVFLQILSLNQISLRINYFRSYMEYPESYCRKDGIPVPIDRLPKVIELKHVSYRYEGGKYDVLHDINLKILPGERLAVVGLNGAGKTTLIKLICGLIDPSEGQVFYDGVDIRKYKRLEFYDLFSAVFQQYSILPVTIEEIVSEAPSGEADRLRVETCLNAAGLWKKIVRLPAGMKSRFGKTIYDDGVEFSGGEVQKLLFARALYKDAPLLILDEPTAALDPIAESHMYENYYRISTGKTSIFVSHRLASTSFCDRILLLENGAVCEEGTHESLLALGGKYSRLFETQAKYYRSQKNDPIGNC